METLTIMDEPNLSAAKKVKGLYLRNLTEAQSDYIITLQEKFKVNTATHAAELALFGFTDMENKMNEAIDAGEKLYKDHLALKVEFAALQRQIASYFQSVAHAEFTKENLLNQVSNVGEPVEAVGSFRIQGNPINVN